MKKAIAIAVFTLILGSLAFQVLAEDSYYCVNVNVVKVYPTAFGYKIIYRTGLVGMYEAYIPNAWFSNTLDTDGNPVPAKAEVIYGNNPSLPYMVVFYKNAKFSHLKLNLMNIMSDPSYGRLEMSADLADKFKVDDLKITF